MKNSTRKVSSTSKTRFNVAHENMLYNVVSFALAAANIVITQSLAAFNLLILSIQSKLQTVDSLRAVTRMPITGYASQKKALRSALEAMSKDIMNAVYSYAIDTNNQVLAEQMLNSPTRLQRYGYRELLQYVNGAIEIIEPLAQSGALASVNITATTVSTWQGVATQLATLISNPQNAIANRETINTSIYQLLNQCMYILTNNCDMLINQFRTQYPDYYNNYWNNRRLHEHHLSCQLRLYVTDRFNNIITQGEVFIEGTPLSATLDENGYALITHIPFGMHRVHVSTVEGGWGSNFLHFKKGKSLTLHVQIGVEDGSKTTSKVTVTEEETPVTVEDNK